MVVIPPGRFRMGATAAELGFGDLPCHGEDMPTPYALSRHTVTAAEFQRYAQATGFVWFDHLIRAEGRLPVINISIGQAADYAAWLSQSTGQRYRLPTEAEWEYAARAGSDTAYCFGDRLTCGEANIHSLQNPTSQVRGWRRFLPFCVPLNRACEVGSYPANVWGLHEMHGNVWEFTVDKWRGPLDAYSSPLHPPRGDWIVTKGGSWFEGAESARSASRRPRLASEIDVNLGFRLLREIAPTP